MHKTYSEKWISLCKAAGESADKNKKLDMLAHDAQKLLDLNELSFMKTPAVQMLNDEGLEKQNSEEAFADAKASAVAALQDINKICEELGAGSFSPIKDDGSNVMEIVRDFISDFFALHNS